jgi:hypothetical protein
MLAIGSLAACAAEPGQPGNETGMLDHGDVWDDIRCHEGVGGERCVGLPAGSDDAWVFVVCENDFEGWNEVEPAWGVDSCRAGEDLHGIMPNHRCFDVDSVGVVCYAGGDGWYTQVVADCDAPEVSGQAWSTHACDGNAGFIGPHPWDSVRCSDEPAGSCVAIDGTTAMLAWPSCWVYALDDAPLTPCDHR